MTRLASRRVGEAGFADDAIHNERILASSQISRAKINSKFSSLLKSASDFIGNETFDEKIGSQTRLCEDIMTIKTGETVMKSL